MLHVTIDLFGFIFIQWDPMTDPDSPVPCLIPWARAISCIMYVSMQTNQQCCYSDHSLKSYTRPFLEETN